MSNAGWWPDPLGRHEMRYHDGGRWTEHVSDQGAVAVNPIEPPPPSSITQPLQASPFAPPTTTPVNSPFGADSLDRALPFGSRPEAPTPLIQEAGTSRRVLWFVVGVTLLGAIVAIAIVLSARADNTDGAAANSTPLTEGTVSPTPVPGTTAIAPPETSPPATEGAPATGAPGTTAVAGPIASTVPAPTAPVAPTGVVPDGRAGAVPVGTTVRAAGSLVRVNSVNLDAPGDDFFEPDAGNTITAIEVEACAGPDGFATNSFYWSAFMPDATVADNYLFADDIVNIELAPGGCIRGIVTFEMPAATPVASIVLTSPTFSEIARWETEGAVAVSERLAPELQPASVPVGSAVTWGPNHRATVQSVEDAAPPLDEFFGPDPGRQYNRVNVEVCAGDVALPVSSLGWFGVGADHWMGTTVLMGDTLPSIELAPGECAAGSVQIGMPEGTGTAAVVYFEPGTGEIARWSTG